MKKGHLLQFNCQSCTTPVQFSIFELEKHEGCIKCQNCSLPYDFKDEVLRRQLRKFEGLCRQLQQSEEILSKTAVGVNCGKDEILVPFNILLTRLNSTLELMIGNSPLKITFLIEPARDVPLLT